MNTRNRPLPARRVFALSTTLIAALFLFYLLAVPLRATAEDAPARWSAEQANAWYAKQPWPVGCNYIPRTAINELEMWQADTFDLGTIDQELGWAQGLGFNSVRVFLHNLLWQQDSKGFLQRMDQFLAVADRHHIRVIFVLFDSCWDPHPHLGQQRAPRPHVHNSGWVQAPGVDIMTDPSRYDDLKPYIHGVIDRFKNDPRVEAWDLFNEPDNGNDSSYGKTGSDTDKTKLLLKLLGLEFGWAREISPSQPLTVCVWRGDWSTDAALSDYDRFALNNSDVITFHNYDPAPKMAAAVDSLKRFGRPIICTEYMARPMGSTFANILPLLKKQDVGALNWGFVDGKTQTKFPWDSWHKSYGDEPPVWFHDIFHADGTPYRVDEVALIRHLTGVTP